MKRRCFLLAVGAAWLTGCGGLTLGLDAPKVALSDIRLVGGGLVEQRFLLTLRVTNPNNRDLEVDSLTYEVELNGEPFAHGTSHRPFTLRALDDTLVEVEGVSNLAALLDQLQGLLRGPNGPEALPYRIHGRLRSGSFGFLPFDRKGEIRLPDEWGGSLFRRSKPKTERF
ncbi:MAG: LEA type 2 family protein [Zoogloeaceae bacterium]|nr:LEA type 2 family protein [Zoogloeaceae bacterium]